MVNTTKKYDWAEIQSYYDEGKSWREVKEHFGVAFGSLQKARARGDLKTERSKNDAQSLTYSRGNRKQPVYRDGWLSQLAEEQSLRNRGGRCKWFEVAGQRVQGTWERDAAIKLEEMGTKWVKVGKHRKDVIWYVLDGKTKAYTPDFFLPDYDLFLEFKGYWWGRDKEKMAAVMDQYPELNIVIVEKDRLHRLLNGEMIWVTAS